MTEDVRLRRVLRVIEVGRRLADPNDSLGMEARRDLLPTSGLSLPGVELALTQHLETDPDLRSLHLLLATIGSAPRCHVILAANVCTAALRAIALAVATAPTAIVRPSRRAPALASLIIRELASDRAFRAADGTIAITDKVTPLAGDELHVYGSDASIAALRASVDQGVVLRGHGTGLGLAVVGATTSLDTAAMNVARDVVPFDQRGCLSPRAVLVEGTAARAAAFANALHRALSDLGAWVPRGLLDAADLGAIVQYRTTIEAVGTYLFGAGHAVGLDPYPRALVLPPAARVVHVIPAQVSNAQALISPWEPYVTAVGTDDESPLSETVIALAPRARRARLGEMQRPPLDGPVDLRQR